MHIVLFPTSDQIVPTLACFVPTSAVTISFMIQFNYHLSSVWFLALDNQGCCLKSFLSKKSFRANVKIQLWHCRMYKNWNRKGSRWVLDACDIYIPIFYEICCKFLNMFKILVIRLPASAVHAKKLRTLDHVSRRVQKSLADSIW